MRECCKGYDDASQWRNGNPTPCHAQTYRTVSNSTAADRTDGQQDMRAHCGDRRPRETGNGAEQKGRAWSGVCGRQTRVRCVDRKILTTGGGSGSHPVAAALSNLTCELRTRCPCIVAIHRSRLTRHLPAPICPFYLSATDAGRPGSD